MSLEGTNTEGSIGARRVRESFNPSKDSNVDKIKRWSADCIDFCEEHKSLRSASRSARANRIRRSRDVGGEAGDDAEMIHPQDDFRAARSMLKELLQEYGDPPIKDYDKLTVQEKTFLAGTCASTVMLFTILRHRAI